MRPRHALSSLILAVSFVTSSVEARAEEAPSGGPAVSMQDRALAEALFREGKELGEAGKIDEACSKFKESQRLDPALGTLLHLGACYELAGRTASAWAAFRAAADQAERAKQADRVELARERADALEQQLSRLVIAASGPTDGLTLEVDGSALGEATLSTPLPLDPGPHEIVVEAPGKRRWTHTFEVPKGPVIETLNVPPLEDAPGSVEVAPAPSATPERPRARVDPPLDDQQLAGFIVGGAGIVALGVGAIFGLRAASQSSDADEHCNGSLCTQKGLDGHSAADTSAWIANVGFGLGLAGLAGGAYLVLTSNSTSPGSVGAAAGAWQVGARGTW